MKNTKFQKKQKVILFILLSLNIGQSFAQYQLKKHSLNNGGGKVSGENYQMNFSIGQIDASTITTGGDYTLNGGFWHKENTPISDLIFNNGFE